MYTTPILNDETQAQVDRAAVQFKDSAKWKSWGLANLRPQGTCILLEGPPGTGKTTVAEYVALRLRRKGIKQIDFAEFGSQVPGENSRQIKRLFKEAADNGGMTVFMDEVEAVLWHRDKIAGSNTWMLEVIDTILAEISRYKYLIVAATNRADMLDPAFLNRCMARIRVDLPDRKSREGLWIQKWPDKFPLKLSSAKCAELAKLSEGLSGRSIENVLLAAASRALVAGRMPTFEDFDIEISLAKM